MRVLLYRVGKAPELTDVSDNPQVISEQFGGYYRPVIVDPKAYLYLVSDEDGKMTGKPYNREVWFRRPDGLLEEIIVVGDFLICGFAQNGGFTDIKDEMLDLVLRYCGGGVLPEQK